MSTSDQDDANNPFARPSAYGRLPTPTIAVGPLPRAAAPPRPRPAPAVQPGVITRPVPGANRGGGLLTGSAVPTGRGDILAGSAVPTGRGNLLTGSVLPSPKPAAPATPASRPPAVAAPLVARAAPEDPVLQDLFQPELLPTGRPETAAPPPAAPASAQARAPAPAPVAEAPVFTPLGVPPRHAPAARKEAGYPAALQPPRGTPAVRRSKIRTPMIAGAALAAFAGCAVGIVLLNRNAAEPAQDPATPVTVASEPGLSAGRLSMATTPLPSELSAAPPAAEAPVAQAPVAQTPAAAPPQRLAAAAPQSRSAPLRRRVAATPPPAIEVPPAATAPPVLALPTPASVVVPPPTPGPRSAPPPADPDAPMATILPDPG